MPANACQRPANGLPTQGANACQRPANACQRGVLSTPHTPGALALALGRAAPRKDRSPVAPMENDSTLI
jgi:hypothetical protein